MADSLATVAPPNGVTPDYRHVAECQLIIRAVIGVTLSIATFFLGLRIYTSICFIKKLELEDPLILLAYLFAVAFNVLDLLLLEYGWGQHLRDISMAQLVVYFKLIIPINIFYILSPSLSKLALMAVYHRTFIERKFRIVVYILAGCVIVYTVVLGIVVPAQCHIRTGRCPPEATLSYIVLNISTDVVLIVLPFPVIYRLNMPRRQKIMVGIVLTVGSMAVVASIIRVAFVRQVTNTTDYTHNSAGPWTILEVNLAITCNCLIRLKPLTMKLFSMFGWSPEGAAIPNGQQQRRKPRTQVLARNGSLSWRDNGSDTDCEMQAFESREDRAVLGDSDVGRNLGAIFVTREFEVHSSNRTASWHGSADEIIRKVDRDKE